MEFFFRAYKNYANFQGRDTEKEYWIFYFIYLATYIFLRIADNILNTEGFLSGAFVLISIIPSIAIATRRLHDIDKSGWWQLLYLVPIIGFIILIVFFIKQGTEDKNRFGDNPRINKVEEQEN